jgi:hypothetical protein
LKVSDALWFTMATFAEVGSIAKLVRLTSPINTIEAINLVFIFRFCILFMMQMYGRKQREGESCK